MSSCGEDKPTPVPGVVIVVVYTSVHDPVVVKWNGIHK